LPPVGPAAPGIRSHLQLGEDFPATRSRDHPEVVRSWAADHGPMSYAIIWVDEGGKKSSGRLDLSPTAVVLTGTGAGAIRELAYDELTGARVERSAQLELPAEPALVLELHDGETLVIGSLEGIGALYELADDLEAARMAVLK
jgi:hypothetical protein